MGPTYYLESVNRVMRVLECFSSGSPELRLTDLSTQLGISKAQALRIATTLESSGYLTRDLETKRFRLGIRLFHLGMLVSQQMDLRRLAHPHLRRLVEATHETARLVVPDDAGPICIDLVESPKGIRVFAQLGMRMPWNAGSSPKLLLAYLPDEQRERILARVPFKAFTERTTTDPDVLREEVLAIRARGFHVGVGDLDIDAAGVSGPIFNHKGHIVGSVNVSAPVSRLIEDEMSRLVVLVNQSAAAISGQLGYCPEPAGHVPGGGPAKEEASRSGGRRG